jgi:hypothetical protein
VECPSDLSRQSRRSGEWPWSGILGGGQVDVARFVVLRLSCRDGFSEFSLSRVQQCIIALGACKKGWPRGCRSIYGVTGPVDPFKNRHASIAVLLLLSALYCPAPAHLRLAPSHIHTSMICNVIGNGIGTGRSQGHHLPYQEITESRHRAAKRRLRNQNQGTRST